MEFQITSNELLTIVTNATDCYVAAALLQNVRESDLRDDTARISWDFGLEYSQLDAAYQCSASDRVNSIVERFNEVVEDSDYVLC